MWVLVAMVVVEEGLVMISMAAHQRLSYGSYGTYIVDLSSLNSLIYVHIVYYVPSNKYHFPTWDTYVRHGILMSDIRFCLNDDVEPLMSITRFS